MKIKEISIKNNDYLIRDITKEYTEDINGTLKLFNKTLADYEKRTLDYYIQNKKDNLLDFEIIE